MGWDGSYYSRIALFLLSSAARSIFSLLDNTGGWGGKGYSMITSVGKTIKSS